MGTKLDKTFYTKYLASPAWEAKRELYFNTYGKRCKACGTTYGAIQLHHMTYERLGRERLGDLVSLCAKCHREVEQLYRRTGRQDRVVVTLAYIKAKRKSKWQKKKG